MIDMTGARQAVKSFQKVLNDTPQELVHVRPSPEAWTLAEIVGHLIDSAGNNHQRFARLRFGDLEGFPGYDAEPWVAAQDYDCCDFALLTGLWAHYNALMLHLAETTPMEVLGNLWKSGDGSPTLEFLINDYYRHLRDHTEHYCKRLAEIKAKTE